MVARMANLELIELYPSPWSERLRWALEWKRVPYARRAYQPLAGEEELRRTTGISTVPVLLADGEVVGDSDAALEWLEAHHPSPALLPADGRLRAQVRAWEIAATETMAPAGRLVMIGRWKARDMQPLADHFAAKYGWSPAEEARMERLLGALVADLARAVAVPGGRRVHACGPHRGEHAGGTGRHPRGRALRARREHARDVRGAGGEGSRARAAASVAGRDLPPPSRRPGHASRRVTRLGQRR